MPARQPLAGPFSGEDRVLALTFAVDLWDYLGWHDTFAQPEFDLRQRSYSRALRARGRSTPQLVLNGARLLNAYDWDEARAEFNLAQADGLSLGPDDLTLSRLRNGRVRVTLGAHARAAGADIWLASYELGPFPSRSRAASTVTAPWSTTISSIRSTASAFGMDGQPMSNARAVRRAAP